MHQLCATGLVGTQIVLRQTQVDSDYALITCNPLRCGSDKRQTRVYSDFTQTIWWGLWLISNIKWWLITKTHKKWFSVYFEFWAFVWPSIILVLHLQQSWAFYILRGLLSSDQLRSTFNIHILHFCCRIIWKNECIFFSFFIAGHGVWDYIFWSPLCSHPSRVQQQQHQKFLSS